MVRQKFAGIDVSKKWFDIAVFVGSETLNKRFAQGPEGFCALDAWLSESGIPGLRVALEHTGGYERALAEHLLSCGHHVSLVNGLQIKRFKESHGMKSKTDRKDALAIAMYCRERRPERWVPRTPVYEALLELWRHRQSLVDGITAWSNRRRPNTVNPVVGVQRDTLVEVLRLQLEALEQEIAKFVALNPELARNVELLTGIGSIRFVTAVGTLAEAGPLECYPTPESLATAAGVAPLPFESGISVKKVRRKPYGNPNLKRVLGLVGSNAKRFDPAVKQFAERIAARGPKSKAAVNRACVRKVLHIMWGIIHSGQPYDPSKAIWKYDPKKT